MVGVLAAGPVPAAADTDRVVAALISPGAESNRFWTSSLSWHMLDPSLEGLVAQDPVTGDYTGDGLAVSWEHSPDFTEWTFKLREGVEFHFGYGEFTAADVIHSYMLHTGEDAIVPGIAQLRGAEVVAVDDHTVRFVYDSPRVEKLFLHGGRTVMKIYSKKQFDEEGLEGYDERFAGTGHYRFVSRSPGRVLYERVENHYSGLTPDFREIEIRFVDEAATKLAMLLAGEAHVADLPRELLADAVAGGMSTVQSARATMQTDICFNGLYCESDDPACRRDIPWFDVRIREAINRAINREEMLGVLFPSGGYALHARYTMVKGNEGHDPALEARFEAEYGYDPELARQLMWHAGYPDAFEDPTIPIVLTPMAGMPEVPLQQEMVYQYLTQVGFQAEIVELDYARVRALGRERKLYMINPGRNAPPRPTEVAFRAFYTNPGGGLQGWEDDWTATHVEELINTIDPAKRDQLARKIQNYLFEQYVDIPLFDGFTQVAINPKYVAGWQFPGVTSAGYGHWHLIRAAR
jgi:ABC-type transport system substrate-binding protein